MGLFGTSREEELLGAAKSGDLEALDAALLKGADINCRSRVRRAATPRRPLAPRRRRSGCMALRRARSVCPARASADRRCQPSSPRPRGRPARHVHRERRRYRAANAPRADARHRCTPPPSSFCCGALTQLRRRPDTRRQARRRCSMPHDTATHPYARLYWRKERASTQEMRYAVQIPLRRIGSDTAPAARAQRQRAAAARFLLRAAPGARFPPVRPPTAACTFFLSLTQPLLW